MTAEEVAWARIRRAGLVARSGSAVDVARGLVGVQSQFLPASGLAIGARTEAPFTASLLDRFLNREKRLLRLWGQRNTVHVYDVTDWSLVVSASRAIPTYRTSLHEHLGETEEAMESALERIGELLRDRDRASRAELAEADPSLEPWLRSGNVAIMELVRRGVACHAGVEGSRSYFAHRSVWLPDVAWAPTDPEEAGRRLAVRYFTAYGPATARDFAFWLGSRRADALRWIERAGDELARVRIGGKSWIDVAAPSAPPEGDAAGWPLRLLYRFDPLLLAHDDKGWLVDGDRYKAVWRKAGYVEAVILKNGRIAGTWTYDRKGRGVEITLSPFGRLTKADRTALAPDAEAVATYFGTALASLADA